MLLDKILKVKGFRAMHLQQYKLLVEPRLRYLNPVVAIALPLLYCLKQGWAIMFTRRGRI